jgi:hypothetical protein
MPLSTDIRLPKDREPVFPEHCCRCFADEPEHTLRFSASRFSWSQLFFFWVWLFRKSVKHDVPVCDGCRGKVRRRKWLEWLLYIVVVGAAVVLMQPWLKSMELSRQWQKIALIGGVFVCALPVILWSVLRPPAFDMTVGEDHIEYEFANLRYAMLFVLFNPGAESDDFDVDALLQDAVDEDDEPDPESGEV